MSDLATTPSHDHDHDHSHAPNDAAPGPESMLLITPTAATKVNEIREAEGIEPNMALRLRVVD